jgi:thiamine kinase-like enzyme
MVTSTEGTIKTLIDLLPRLRGKELVVKPLKGGLTNRNYYVECGADRFVLRIPGENSRLLGIDRQTEHACAQAAFAARIGPQVVAFCPARGAMVTSFVPGRVLIPGAVRRPSVLRRVVASLRRYHRRPGGAGRFSAFETVRRYYALAQKRAVQFPQEIVSALATLARIEEALGPPARLCPCHNDLLAANFVDDQPAVRILDWEYAGMGDLFFDLGNLAANNRFGHNHEKTLLQYYFGEARPADLWRLRLMRLASDMREAMWGFVQMGISKLDFDYRRYARSHLRRFLQGAIRFARSRSASHGSRLLPP